MLRHAPWLYEMHYDGDFYVFFVTHDRKNQKNCFDFDDDARYGGLSPRRAPQTQYLADSYK